jgi:hypothetical protein
MRMHKLREIVGREMRHLSERRLDICSKYTGEIYYSFDLISCMLSGSMFTIIPMLLRLISFPVEPYLQNEPTFSLRLEEFV